MRNTNFTQDVAVLDLVTPAAARAAGSYVSQAIDASVFDRITATLLIGTLAGAGTVNLRFQHNSVTTSTDGGWADVNTASCITSTFTSAKNDNIARLELRLDQNPTTSRYVRAFVSAATSTWLGGVVVEGKPALYQPASQFNNAVVAVDTVY